MEDSSLFLGFQKIGFCLRAMEQTGDIAPMHEDRKDSHGDGDAPDPRLTGEENDKQHGVGRGGQDGAERDIVRRKDDAYVALNEEGDEVARVVPTDATWEAEINNSYRTHVDGAALIAAAEVLTQD
jgi:hypothetical protein